MRSHVMERMQLIASILSLNGMIHKYAIKMQKVGCNLHITKRGSCVSFFFF